MDTILRVVSRKSLPIPALLFTFILTFCWCAGQAQLIGYDVSTQANYGVSLLAPSFTAPAITAGGLTKGSGVVTTTGVAATGGWGGTGWNYVSPGAAIAGNAYITFTVKANTGYVLSLASFNEFDYRRSSTGPDSALIQYAINNNTFINIGTIAFTSISAPGASIGGISLSSIAALQNLPATSTVTFRIVPYRATVSSGTFYIFNKNGTDEPDLSLAGTVNSVSGVTYYSKSTGKLNALSTWGTNTDGSGSAPVNFSADNQIFNIQNRGTATIGAAWSVSGVNSKIVVGDWSNDVTFTIPDTYPVTGNIDVASYATLVLSNSNIPALGILALNSTVNYSGISSQNIAARSYRNLAINNAIGVILTGDITVNDALRLTNGTLTIGGSTLTVNGYISSKGAGTLSGSPNSNIIFGGYASTPSTLNFTSIDNTIRNLTINAGATVTLADTLNIVAGNKPGTVIVNGTLTTNGNLILKSNAGGTARVGTSNGTISGDVTVERYIPAKPSRKWTLLASPVSVSVRNSWQQQIFVTGPGTGGTPCGNTNGNGGATDKYNSNGFDDTRNDPSTIFTYEQNYAAGTASYFTPVASTSVLLMPGTGYRVNIRGDRNTANACAAQINYIGAMPPAGAVTLKVTGAYTSSAVKALNFSASNIYTLVGNPYPSELSLSSFIAGNSRLINPKAWFYCGVAANTSDVYTVYNNGQLTNDFLPAANKIFTNGALTDVVVSSGEAFFVEAKAAGSVSFNEVQKTTANANGNNIYSRQLTPLVWTNYVRVHLFKQADSVAEMDNIIIRFRNDGQVNNAQYGAWDAISLNSIATSVASLKNGNRMAIQTRRLDFLKKDTVHLAVNAAIGNYQLYFTEFNQFSKAKFIYLVDQYLHTVTNIKQQNSYAFSITADTLSKGNNRFMMVFSTVAINNNTTNFINNLLGKTGLATSFALYPNPVRSQLHIRVLANNNMHYQLTILSSSGAVIIKKEGISSNNLISLSTADIAKGTYIADLYFANGAHFAQQFIIQ